MNMSIDSFSEQPGSLSWFALCANIKYLLQILLKNSNSNFFLIMPKSNKYNLNSFVIR